MSTATIEVAYANEPKDGRKQATIKTTDGQIFGCWPDTLGLLRPGERYEIEFAERVYNDKTYRTIRKATKVERLRGESNGVSHHNGGNGIAAVSSAITPAEHDFVTRMLAASIQACAVTYTEQGLVDTARMLRAVYRKAMS